ncbi:MAG: DUF427 domain-containing protein [Gemmatimonadetes bacterium]|nr:DUF427 domain-containing protein [Gemmatimonadota bacterium]
MTPDLPSWARSGRAGWRWTGGARPTFAKTPGPGQESVWDYPRPPAIVSDPRRVVVRLGETTIAETTRAVRVLETASAPTFYVPRSDVRMAHLERASRTSHCEWKGSATYWTVRTPDGEAVERGAWSYEDPFDDFSELAGYLSFYPSSFECLVGGERAQPQGGGFYGGWVTSEVVGPMKGDPGTGGW